MCSIFALTSFKIGKSGLIRSLTRSPGLLVKGLCRQSKCPDDEGEIAFFASEKSDAYIYVTHVHIPHFIGVIVVFQVHNIQGSYIFRRLYPFF